MLIYSSVTVQQICYEKNSTRTTMKIPIVCMALTLISISAERQPYNLVHRSDSIFDPNLRSTSEDRDSLCNHYAPVKRHDEFAKIDEMRPMSKEFISARSSPWHWMCPCETQYDIANLGPGNYPRYLAVASCIPKSCHGKLNFCKLIYYKVHVLKERDLNDPSESNEEQFIEQPILPESLSIKWQLKPMKIAVACIAATGQ